MAKKMNTKRPRNYAATEATLINVRALKKDVQMLKARVALLEAAQTPVEPPPAQPPEEPDQPLDVEPLAES